MGSVWRAQRADGLFAQTVAIKFMNAALDWRASEAFANERRILASLEHVNIVKLIDGGIASNGAPYLIMDLVNGQPLDQAWQTEDLKARIRLLIEVARTVQFAHGRFVAHGDLKPANILVDDQQRPRLLDFGISRLLNAERDLAPTRGAMTREFASPQRLAGAPASIADDIYALGVLVRRACELQPGADLAAIIAKATDPDELKRYFAASELARDLERWLQRKPVSARPDRWPYRLILFVRRNLALVAAASGALASLIAFAILAVLAAQSADRSRKEAEARFADARGAAHYLIFTQLDRLQEMPNSLELRRETVEVAERYLRRLAQSSLTAPNSGAGVGLRSEIAEGLIRLAEAEGVPGKQNIDRPDLAHRDLDRALYLISQDKTPSARWLEVRGLLDRARLLDYAENRANQALPDVDRAVAIAEANASVPQVYRAKAYIERADVLGWQSRWTQSVTAAKQGLALLAGDTSLEAALAAPPAYELIAEAENGFHNNARSLEGYLNEVKGFQDAVRRFPGSRQARVSLARAEWQYGAAFIADAPGPRPLAWLERAERELVKAAAWDRTDTHLQRLIGYEKTDRARMLAKLGRTHDAIALLQDLVKTDQNNWAAHPTENQWLRDLIIDIAFLGEVEVKHGLREEGCAQLKAFHRRSAELAEKADPNGLFLQEASGDVVASETRYCRPDPALEPGARAKRSH